MNATWTPTLQERLRELGDIFFRPGFSWFSRTLYRLTLVGLFLIGFFQWGDFLNWGKPPFDLGDWYDI
ncbi:MAG: hypothetical protein KA988_02605, partial [Longilinea sp.]|nr:hypothetical protein [Longilinea sp.]